MAAARRPRAAIEWCVARQQHATIFIFWGGRLPNHCPYGLSWPPFRLRRKYFIDHLMSTAAATYLTMWHPTRPIKRYRAVPVRYYLTLTALPASSMLNRLPVTGFDREAPHHIPDAVSPIWQSRRPSELLPCRSYNGVHSYLTLRHSRMSLSRAR